MIILGAISDNIQIYHDVWDIENWKLQMVKISVNQYKTQKKFTQ